MRVPLVSVVIPTYRRSWCVGRAVESARAQTLRDIEVFVVDDASEDGTGTLIASIAGSDLKLVTHVQNGGASVARNTGVAQAQGRYVAFLDSDDEWDPRKLERQVALLESSPAVVGVNCGLRLLRPGTREVTWVPVPGTNGLDAQLAMADPFDSATLWVFRRDALARLDGPFEPALRYAQVRDLLVRAAQLGPLASIREVLAVIHDHGRHPRNQCYPLATRAASHRLFLARHERELVARPRSFARLLGDAAWRSLELGEVELARSDLARALRLHPWSRRTVAIALASLLPHRFRESLRALRRRVVFRRTQPTTPRPDLARFWW